nr:MAG TPA: hypothetical protein [Caudoviricetes sp.]
MDCSETKDFSLVNIIACEGDFFQYLKFERSFLL